MTTGSARGGPSADLEGSRARITNRAHLDGDGPVAKGADHDQVRKEMPMLPLILSSDSHVFEPPDLWQTRLDRALRDPAARVARFDAPETISAQGRLADVHRGGYVPAQHLEDMALDGVAGEVRYPSQGL